MKALALSFILIIGLSGTPLSSQDIFPLDENGKIVYTEVVKVDSVSASDLFVRANDWFAHSFVSAKNVIQLSDKEARRLLGKGNFLVSTVEKGIKRLPGIIDFVIEVQTKDGRYKYSISELSYKMNHDNTEYDLLSSTAVQYSIYQKKFDRWWLEVKQNTNAYIQTMIDGLKKHMGTNADNW